MAANRPPSWLSAASIMAFAAASGESKCSWAIEGTAHANNNTQKVQNILLIALSPASATAMESAASATAVESAATKSAASGSAPRSHAGEAVVALHARHSAIVISAEDAVIAGVAALLKSGTA
jgi:hypothetical protein